MTDSICPNCGQAGVYSPPGPCDICAYSLSRTLFLLTEDGTKAREMNTTKHFDMHWSRTIFGEESKYWDRRNQYSIQPDGSSWFLLPNPSSQNQTLVNGGAITGSYLLQEGDVISVGNEERATEKTKLIVTFDL